MADASIVHFYPAGWQDLAAGATPLSHSPLQRLEDNDDTILAQANLALSTALAALAAAGSSTSYMPYTTITVKKDTVTGFWPHSYDAVTGAAVYTGGSASAGVRPTNRTDVVVQWKGADPSPAIVSSGTGGMIDGVDMRLIV